MIKLTTNHRTKKGRYASLTKMRVTTLILFTSSVLLSGFVYWYHLPSDLISPLIEGGEAVSFINPEPVQAVSPQEPEVKTEKQEIIDYIVKVFGEDSPEAFNVLRCENKNLNPTAVNTSNSNGSIDEGIFQINSIHGQPNMQEWHAKIDYAYKIFERQGWTPWSCSHRVGIKSFWE